MCSEVIIKVEGVSKRYEIYKEPRDRLKQLVFPALQRIIGIKKKKYFKDFWALKDVSFEVKRGETLGIIGKNGSGKSTLLQIICGTLKPTTGKIIIQGRIAALLELGSGFNPEFTGRENVYLNATILGLTSEEIEERYEDIAKFADIGDFINQPVKTYSSGMMVRLAFAVIAHVSADILVVDEALAVGDMLFTQKCFRFINEFKKHGVILFVSHDSGAVANISNSAIWLNEGAIKSAGITVNVLDEYHRANLLTLDSITNLNHYAAEITTPESEVKYLEPEYPNQLNSKAAIGGAGKARIISAGIWSEKNRAPLKILTKTDTVIIHLRISVLEEITGLLVGFTIKDSLGQKIIEENNSAYVTPKTMDIKVPKNSDISIKFEYIIPALAAGNYSVDFAVAEGMQTSHITHCWIYDGIQFESMPEDEVFGLVSIAHPKFNMETING
jgi:lipopolysaccharide transport system ATP-binding protein